MPARGTPHVIPCAGLIELQVMSARMDTELQEARAYQARQNGTSQRIEVKLDASVEKSQKQIEGVQRQISDNHVDTMKQLSTRDRQTLFLLAGIVIVMRAPDIISLGNVLTKVIWGR